MQVPDKQTYYKLTTSGDESDSIVEMAKNLLNGGCMHGDIALVEAAMSLRSFFHLVDIGVPFSHSRYDEYVGYKTDHDPKQRATLEGPLTSKFMTEKLFEQVRNIELPYAFQNYDILISQFVYQSALESYIENGGKSRGSFLFHDPNGILPTDSFPELFQFSITEKMLSNKIQVVTLRNGTCVVYWEPVRPIPANDDWFENVWNDFMKDRIVK